MSYVDLQTIHNPATGNVAPASWGDQVRDNFEALAEPPSCRVYHSAQQLLTHATWTTLLANTESWDSASMHSTSSNTSRIAVPSAGIYLFNATAEFGDHPTGMRWLRFLINGSATQPFFAAAVTAYTGARGSGFTMRDFTAGQYVEVQALQNSGNDTITGQLLEFAAVKVSR